MDKEILYTVDELTKILKTSKSRVYDLIKAGFLPALKLGRYKVRRSTLMKFLEEAEGKDLNDLNNIRDLKANKSGEEKEENKNE